LEIKFSPNILLSRLANIEAILDSEQSWKKHRFLFKNHFSFETRNDNASGNSSAVV
jgi:hypothetical protein